MLEWRLLMANLPNNYSIRVNIRGFVVAGALNNFWGHPLKSPYFIGHIITHWFGPSKVAKLCSQRAVDENVERFKISMQNRRIKFVQVIHPSGYIQHELYLKIHSKTEIRFLKKIKKRLIGAEL